MNARSFEGHAASVAFVSAGPGAADLITLRGLQRLSEAEVVLADALADPALRGLAPSALWIDVGKRGYQHVMRQAEINDLLVHHAQTATGLVVRLKGGDASVFGRLEEELQALHAAGISCEVVPGVTAALAAAAQAQRPLTRRGMGRSVTFTTAMTREGEVPTSKPHGDTEVFYMAGAKLPALQQRLLADGWAPQAPVLVVSRAGYSNAFASEHPLERLTEAVLLHHRRPTVVTIGAGACRVPGVPSEHVAARANPSLLESSSFSGLDLLP